MAKPDRTEPRRPGRPPATTHHDLAEIALARFTREGFAETSLTDIAEAAGISRRTVLRYYPSKNDIVWGDFSAHLEGLRRRLAGTDRNEPVLSAVRREVMAFNDYDEAEIPQLRQRMWLILNVPALQAHAMLRHADWCAVIADFVGRRLDVGATQLAPQLVANASLAVALTAYREWIADTGLDLLVELDRGFALVAEGLSDAALGSVTSRG